MCRAHLPDGAQKLFEDAMRVIVALDRRYSLGQDYRGLQRSWVPIIDDRDKEKGMEAMGMLHEASFNQNHAMYEYSPFLRPSVIRHSSSVRPLRLRALFHPESCNNSSLDLSLNHQPPTNDHRLRNEPHQGPK